MEEPKTKEKKDKWEIGGIFVPAGLFIGMGIGFWINQLVAGLFIGLGIGLALLATSLLIKR